MYKIYQNTCVYLLRWALKYEHFPFVIPQWPPRMPRIRHPVKHELRPICIGRCLPEGYSRWAEGPFTRWKKLDSWWRFNHFGDLVFEIGIWPSCMACMLYAFFWFLDCIIIYTILSNMHDKKTISQIHIHPTRICTPYVHPWHSLVEIILFFGFTPKIFLWKKTDDGACHRGIGHLVPGTCNLNGFVPRLVGCLGWFGDTFGWSPARGLINVFLLPGIYVYVYIYIDNVYVNIYMQICIHPNDGEI